MKKSLGLLLVLLLACMFSFAACAGECDVKIDEEHFPDPVFRKEVEQYDLDHDGIIYYKDNEIAMTQAEYDALIDPYVPDRAHVNLNWQLLTKI